MENKTSYTMKEAKDEIAAKHGYSSWKAFVSYEITKHATTTFWDFICQAAELYKEKATEELRKERDELKSTVERLTQAYRYIHASRNAVDEEMKGLIEIHHQQSQELLFEIERLKESNKELVEALNDLVSGTNFPGANWTIPTYFHQLFKTLIEKSKP